MSFLFGSRGRTQQLPTQSPQQQQFFNQFLSNIGGGGEGFNQSMQYLMDLLSGSPEAFSAFEAPYLSQFKEQTLPAISERLTGMGGGARGSSGASQTFAQAGTGLQEKLAALRASLQGQAANQLMSSYFQGAGLGLGTHPFGYQYEPGDPGFLRGLTPGIGGGIGEGIGDLLRRLFGGGQ